MKKLNELIDCDYDILISGIKTDSREVKPNDLFVCIHGLYSDHHDFIDQAIEKGAVALIVDRQIKTDALTILVKDTNEALIDLCQKFYDDPTSKLKVIGVTGTDGKTTTASMIQQLLDGFSKTAYIGTNGCQYLNCQIPASNTTPVPEKLYDYLNTLVKKQIDTVSLEVSSEALLHGRVAKIAFDVAILTNITEDHLNIHKTLENYVNAKAKLFEQVKEDGFCILNKDDPNCDTIASHCRGKIVTYGENEGSDFLISDIRYGKFTKFKLIFGNEEVWIESPYLGKYNVWNLTAAFIVGILSGYDRQALIEKIKQMQPIMGRCEQLYFGQDYRIILDYAHTENAIRNVLSTIQNLKGNKVISITGSAGGREKEKRKGMGKAVLELSDFVIFTMDDPREEDVNSIIDDLIKDSKKTNYMRIIDRKKAITYALDIAQKDDIVIVLGKGRDPYMAIGKEYVSYSDLEVIQRYFHDR